MKFNIKSHWITFIAAFYFMSVLNLSFWRFVSAHLQLLSPSDYIFLISTPILMFSLFCILFSAIVWPYITKPILIFLLISASVANYAMYNLGIYIDSDMIRNILQTNQREANDLITFSGVTWILILGILPSILLIRANILYRPFFKEVSFKVLIAVISIVTIGIIAAISYKDYAAFGRNNRQVVRLINPINYIHATLRYYKKQALLNKEFVHIDPLASYQPYPDEAITVFIIVLGETARSMNFSLNGYSRNTNPKLSQQDVISFKDVASCGTATATSVPCLFSNMSRQNYDADKVSYTDNLLDLLKNTNYQILWRENDDGCKGVCNRVPTEDMVALNNSKYCDGTVCFDEVLLDGLEDYLKKVDRDAVIVLHTIGSHGPTYYKRYPDAFKIFTPTCETAEIQNCTQESIINTYDNTIAYTDHVVSGAIDILKKFPNFESGLLYVSDHGESLGENNIYLHGIPYRIAPKEQTHVPFILWLSELMQKEDHLDVACLKKEAETSAISHDYFFHSLMTLMEVQSNTYDAALDLFAPCRTQPLPRK